jgi:predicted amidophosphoribosyltransferase
MNEKLLEGAFQVDEELIKGKNLLLVDDLYRSGATAAAVTNILLSRGAGAVNLLAMTKTRTRS